MWLKIRINIYNQITKTNVLAEKIVCSFLLFTYHSY